MGRTLVIAIYSHPEYYPPTLNAIDQLSGQYERIYVLHRNVSGFDWQYPENVELIGPGQLLPVREAERAGYLKKIGWFLGFTWILIRLLWRKKPDTLLLYDCIPVLAWRLARWVCRAPAIIWYHNHDVPDPKYIRRFSINWFAWKSESWIFPRLSIFSLPSVERKQYFPMKRLGGVYLFIPNFPSWHRYPREALKSHQEFVLLYQGSIGPMHGLEQIIPLLGNRFNDLPLRLVLKGFMQEAYWQSLLDIARQHGVQEKLEYKPPSGYQEVINNACACHIGIGIFMKDDIMNKTLGTASNKIYEYAAAGMPVLLYDNVHFRKQPGVRDWVFFTDTSASSLTQCLQDIARNYEHLSHAARKDFEDHYSFEEFFSTAIPYIQIEQVNGK